MLVCLASGLNSGRARAGEVTPIFDQRVDLGDPFMVVETGGTFGYTQGGPFAYDRHGHGARRVEKRIELFDPATPRAPFVTFTPNFQTNRPTAGKFTFMASDFSGLWVVGHDDERMEVRLVEEGDWDAAVVHTFRPADGDDVAALFAQLSVFSVGDTMSRPAGPCFAYSDVVWCLDLATHSAEIVARAADLEAEVARDSAYEWSLAEPYVQSANMLPTREMRYWWTFERTLILPDGRIVVAARRQLGLGATRPPPGPGLAYLFEVARAGQARLLYGPLKEYEACADGCPPSVGILRNAELHYWPALDAVAIRTRLDHGWQDVREPSWELGHPATTPHAWQGNSFMLVRLDGTGRGFVSLTDAIVRRLTCQMGAYADGCYQAGSGFAAHPEGIAVHVTNTLDRNNTRHRLDAFLLEDVLTPDVLDLDEDGLKGAEEALLGTSDWQRDSDGGGTSDFAEARLSIVATDPTDASDDPARLGDEAAPPIFVSSPLIGLRLPVERASSAARTYTQAGPICMGKTCHGPDGRVVLDISDLSDARTLFLSADARALFVRRTDDVVRVMLADGRRDVFVSGPDVMANFPRDPLVAAQIGNLLLSQIEIVPLDAERVWFVSQAVPARAVLYADGAFATRYDGLETQCASKLGPCDPGPFPDAPNLTGKTTPALPGLELAYADLPTDDIDPYHLTFVGYEPVTERLLLGVHGNWQTWVIGLGVEAAPIVVARQHALLAENSGVGYVDNFVSSPRMPTGYLPLADGLRLTDHYFMDAWGDRRRGAIEVFAATGPATAGWGDTTVYPFAKFSDFDSVYEIVRYRPELEPGDVLVLHYGVRDPSEANDRWWDFPRLSLYHGKARGGLRRVWSEEDVADYTATGIAGLTGPSLRGVVGVDATLDGLCATDGARVALWRSGVATGRMPIERIFVRDIGGGDGRDCLVDADGSVLVLAGGQLLRAEAGGDLESIATLPAAFGTRLTRLPNGAIAVADADGAVVDLAGQPVDVEALARAAGWAEPSWALALDQLRPDGLVIHDDLSVDDRVTGAVGRYAWERFAGEVRVAIVPGGSARDPWTGDVRVRATVLAEPDESAGPAHHEARDDGPGCGAAGKGRAPASAFLAVLTVVALVARRVRVSRPAPSRR